VFWADERAVPPGDPESNYGMARTLLLEPAGVPSERTHPMDGQAADLDRAAEAYGDELARVLGTPPRLDLALLGVGPDGHVASLFPGHPVLREEAHAVSAVYDAPKPPARRLTLTLPVLASAAQVVVFATGEAKARMLRTALEHPDSRLPVALLARRAPRVTFLLDPDAASAL
jgi:6-phosphogluconolactonase